MRTRALIAGVALILVVMLNVTFAFAQRADTSTEDVYRQKTDDNLRNAYAEAKGQPIKVVINVKQGKLESTLNIIPQDKVYDYFSGAGAEVIGAEITENELKALITNNDIISVGERVTMHAYIDGIVDIVDAPETWDIEVDGVNLDGTGETICLIDSGVDFTHPVLDHTKVIDNLNCYDAGGTTPCFVDPAMPLISDHGTGVAGVLAAQGAVDGVAPNAKIISLNVFAPPLADSFDNFDLQRALAWCIDNRDAYNLSVISLSLGTDTIYTDDCDSVPSFAGYASGINIATSMGLPVVAATGNDGSSTAIGSPACINNAIAVGASSGNPFNQDIIWFMSNYNQDTWLFAPGAGVSVPTFGGGYKGVSGTSAAAPVVSASIAILSMIDDARGTSITPGEMEQLLFETGGELDVPFDSHRRVNLFDAVMARQVDFLRGDANMDGTYNVADSITVLDYLFNEPAQPITCRDSLDVNDDGSINIADAILLLNYVFGTEGVTTLPEPFGTPGADPTDTDPHYCF